MSNDRKIIIALLCLLLASCQQRIERNVISFKSHFDFNGKSMPKGICRFAVGEGYESTQFNDSCHFYHVLDTLPKLKSNEQR